jgi:hypothetical protein
MGRAALAIERAFFLSFSHSLLDRFCPEQIPRFFPSTPF